MKYKRGVFVGMFMLAVLALAACGGGSEPPEEALVIELLNERDGVQAEYTILGMTECLVEADQPGIVANWGVRYTRDDMEGDEPIIVHVVMDADGEWSLTERDHCAIR
jgi:hypothetical protein